MTTDERLDRLTGIVESLASTVVAHDNQIEALLRIAEKHDAALANLERQWQACINTLPRQ
jgi:methylglyoxal synthase